MSLGQAPRFGRGFLFPFAGAARLNFNLYAVSLWTAGVSDPSMSGEQRAFASSTPRWQLWCGWIQFEFASATILALQWHRTVSFPPDRASPRNWPRRGPSGSFLTALAGLEDTAMVAGFYIVLLFAILLTVAVVALSKR